MNGSSGKRDKPISNPTSSLARELMLRTLEKLAVDDNDKALARRVKRIRRQQRKET